jgi:hypothetical protein
MTKTDFSTVDLTTLAAIVCSTLEQHDIDAVLVGGACVAIYSQGEYASYDLDLVSYTPLSKIRKALQSIGFTEEGKYFVHRDCPFFLDFVSPPLAIGREQVTITSNLETPSGEIKLLTATDCVKDRLAAFYHWDDQQSLEQALLVSKCQQIDLKQLEQWSKDEGFAEKYQHYLSILAD